MKVQVTPEIMTKVWKLHEKEIDFNLIAETLGISESSARRIVLIMTTAQSGGDVDSLGGNNHRRQKTFAKKYFGIEEKKEEIEEQEEEQKELECVSSVADMQKLLAMLAWQNELLETLLLSLGVDWKTKCKGVERR